MFYLIVYLLFYPILLVFSMFRKKNSKNLIIQTAKIGDYVNTTVIFNELDNFDIVIDKINYEFAKNNPKIKNIYFIDKKQKYKFAFKLFWNNYQNIYILMPNSYNLFLGKISFSKNVVTIQHYSTKWYEKLLMTEMKKIIYNRKELTVQIYLKMLNETDVEKNWKNLPLIADNQHLITSNKFKVGISLSAGNKLKTIDNKTWQKIFNILSKFDLEIYFFGVENEKIFLEQIKPFIKNNYTSLFGKIKLVNLPFYISKMNLYISSDTGNSYIADTFKIPIITFAGPCDMNEQRPINKNTLVVTSNVKETPFSFVFKTAYKSNLTNLYTITKHQEKEIKDFIIKIYRDFQFS